MARHSTSNMCRYYCCFVVSILVTIVDFSDVITATPQGTKVYQYHPSHLNFILCCPYCAVSPTVTSSSAGDTVENLCVNSTAFKTCTTAHPSNEFLLLVQVSYNFFGSSTSRWIAF